MGYLTRGVHIDVLVREKPNSIANALALRLSCANPSMSHRIMIRRLNEPTEAHDDVLTWKRFLHYWPFVRGIHRSPTDSPYKRAISHAEL